MDVALRRYLVALEGALGDPRRGLPEDAFLFISRVTPLVNVDLLVRDDRSRTLLTWRDDEFFGAGWHVPGGIIRYKESAADRLRACARDELGAEVACDAPPIFVSETIRSQDTRGHFISLLYRCRLLSQPDEARKAASDPPASGQWRWHDRCPPDLIEAQRQYAPFF
ncbi:MAG TPA: NUDIX domain-containing protein [Vicinamibacterales bacterium]|nr:NUDIX domain-containing protein [Vicinamibacterales bacterium]